MTCSPFKARSPARWPHAYRPVFPERRRPPSIALVAYDLYLRAQLDGRVFQSQEEEYYHRRETVALLLEQAVARDGQFALAYAELATNAIRVGGYENDIGQTVAAQTHRQQAEMALAKAVRLRPDAGEVRLAQAHRSYEFDGNDEEAWQELALARRALPNNADVENLASFLARERNDWPDAKRCLERALILEPRNIDRRFDLAMVYRLLRRFEDSDRESARIIAALPQRNFAGVPGVPRTRTAGRMGRPRSLPGGV